MAKILDKIRPSSQQRLLPLQRNDKALRAELEYLPQVLREKKEKQLSAYGRKLNKRLEKSAFAACDKEAYAQHQLMQELQRYDVKQYLAQRAVNHGCAKAIFAAIAKGEPWQSALETQKQQMTELAAQREAYLKQLQEKKQAFLAKTAQQTQPPTSGRRNSARHCMKRRSASWKRRIRRSWKAAAASSTLRSPQVRQK